MTRQMIEASACPSSRDRCRLPCVGSSLDSAHGSPSPSPTGLKKKMGQVAHFPKVHFQKVEASRTNLVLIPVPGTHCIRLRRERGQALAQTHSRVPSVCLVALVRTSFLRGAGNISGVDNAGDPAIASLNCRSSPFTLVL